MATVAGAAAYVSRPLLAQGTPSKPDYPQSSHGFINLGWNENQFGPSPKAKQAMMDAQPYAAEYPVEGQKRLQEVIARRERVAPEQVILGAGSADLLCGLANSLWQEKGDNIVSSEPTFAILTGMTRKFGLEHIQVPWTKDYGVDLAGLEAAITPQTKVVYICNPENPTAVALDPARLRDFCKRVSKRCMVLIDEAYLDFAGNADELGMTSCVRDGLDVVVLRTFSKAYGLAGMRVGYAVGPAERLKTISDFYMTGIGLGCSYLSIEAALAAYQDRKYIDFIREQNTSARAALCAYLDQKGLRYASSSASFVFIPVDRDAKQLSDAILGAFNVQISPRFYYDQHFIRISMGRPDQMEQLIKALDYVL